MSKRKKVIVTEFPDDGILEIRVGKKYIGGYYLLDDEWPSAVELAKSLAIALDVDYEYREGPIDD